MNITIFDNQNAIAEALLGKIKELLDNRPGHVTIALSGGETPKAVFKYWAQHGSSALDWSRLRFFWVDERCVPSTSDESNYGVAKRLLFDALPITSEQITEVRGEEFPNDEARRLDARLQELLPTSNGTPVFDLVLLGMGTDGHTASIFPGQMNLLYSPYSYNIGIHPATGQRRITLSGKVINNARTVIFVVTGPDKATVVREIQTQSGNWKEYPASYIEPAGQLLWYVDSAVGAGIVR